MRCPLFRPLNAPILSLMTELGERLFLLDTGCPISFAEHARELMAHAWFEYPLPLQRPPFSLVPLRERLGLPIEGFIGLNALLPHQDIFFDFDAKLLILGQEARQLARSYVDTGVQHLITPLTPQQRAPIMLTVFLEGEERHCYLDTGSRFIITQAQQPFIRQPHTALYRLALISPFGSIEVEVSNHHQLHFEGYDMSEQCVATGAPPQHPNILGMEWLTHFNALLSFSDQTALFFPRSISGQIWEHLKGSIELPPVEFVFTDDQFSSEDRSFLVLPKLGLPLPSGLVPFTPYRLKDIPIPAGIEGINHFMNTLTSTHNPITFITADHEVEIERMPLFSLIFPEGG